MGGNRIADDLLLQLAGQIELDPARQRIVTGQRNVQAPRRERDGPALDQERGQHHHEAISK